MRVVRSLVLLLAGVSATAAIAQQRELTPAEIAAALAAPAAEAPVSADEDDGSMAVGEERSFSLARAAGHGSSARKPAAGLVRSTGPRPAAGRGTARRSFAATTRAVPAAGAARASLDMQLTFANGSAELDAATRRRIDPFAIALTQPPLSNSGRTFRIEGHTNSVGARASNLDLSQRRAKSVVDYLVAKGVPSAMLAGNGFGPDVPLAGVSRADGANRRVEIVRN